jgi:hypothetical protein
MKEIIPIKVAVALGALLIVGCATYWIAFYTVAPSFVATATRQADGAYRVHISPNFIVSSVDRVTIAGPRGMVADQTNRLAGSKTVLVPTGITPGDTLSITCRLNYDRLVPSTTDKTQRVVIR